MPKTVYNPIVLRKVIFAGVIVFAAIAAIFFSSSGKLERFLEKREQARVRLPLLTTVTPKKSYGSSVAFSGSVVSALAREVNWDVPFTPQAPLAVWDELHEEACEEASVEMVLKYFRGEKISSVADAEKDIRNLVKKNEALGFTVDDTAEQVRSLILAEEPALKVKLIKDPKMEDLKNELSAGALVIVPAAGRELKNPYFQIPGPRYHMLVLRGYTSDDYVITNDPGTKRGEQYVYRWSRLSEAMHDWNDGDVEHGARVAISVGW